MDGVFKLFESKKLDERGASQEWDVRFAFTMRNSVSICERAHTAHSTAFLLSPLLC